MPDSWPIYDDDAAYLPSGGADLHPLWREICLCDSFEEERQGKQAEAVGTVVSSSLQSSWPAAFSGPAPNGRTAETETGFTSAGQYPQPVPDVQWPPLDSPFNANLRPMVLGSLIAPPRPATVGYNNFLSQWLETDDAEGSKGPPWLQSAHDKYVAQQMADLVLNMDEGSAEALLAGLRGLVRPSPNSSAAHSPSLLESGKTFLDATVEDKRSTSLAQTDIRHHLKSQPSAAWTFQNGPASQCAQVHITAPIKRKRTGRSSRPSKKATLVPAGAMAASAVKSRQAPAAQKTRKLRVTAEGSCHANGAVHHHVTGDSATLAVAAKTLVLICPYPDPNAPAGVRRYCGLEFKTEFEAGRHWHYHAQAELKTMKATGVRGYLATRAGDWMPWFERVVCDHCGSTFGRYDTLASHMKNPPQACLNRIPRKSTDRTVPDWIELPPGQRVPKIVKKVNGRCSVQSFWDDPLPLKLVSMADGAWRRVSFSMD